MDFEEQWHLGRWRGTDLYLHWTALLIFPWLFIWFHSLIMAMVGTAAYLVLHLVHEAGHLFMARRRRLYVESITLTGLHSRTTLGTTGTWQDQVYVAWGGVLAQLLLLALTRALGALPLGGYHPALAYVSYPVVFIFTEWNIFLMVVALLPIGPMDGHRAWQIIDIIKRRRKNRRQQAARPKKLTEAERVALEQRSAAVADDIIRKISKVE